MTAVAGQTKRTYLRAQERRRAILDVAAEVVAQRGLAHLSMAGVAAEAGVSRQLLYRYFAGIDDLVLAMVTHRFAAIIAHDDAQFSQRPSDRAGVVRERVEQALRLEPSDQRLLRNVFGDVGQLAPEVGRAVVVLRELLVERWVGVVDDESRRAELGATVWAAFHAMVGIWDYLADGTITDEEARVIADRLASMVEAAASSR